MKDIGKKVRRQTIDWKEIFAKGTSEKGLLAKIYKEILRLIDKKRNKQLKNKHKTWTPHTKILYRCQISIQKDTPHHMSSGKGKLKQQ